MQLQRFLILDTRFQVHELFGDILPGDLLLDHARANGADLVHDLIELRRRYAHRQSHGHLWFRPVVGGSLRCFRSDDEALMRFSDRDDLMLTVTGRRDLDGQVGVADYLSLERLGSDVGGIGIFQGDWLS